ncbi:MAG: glycosyl hydrolase family 17 [bacterium]|nr:glycosyl hydrolase family 17 [bacterium]
MFNRSIILGSLLVLCVTIFLVSCAGEQSQSTSNSILGNGQKLLGNNNYPAIAYSGHRKAVRSVENTPDLEETKEDLLILAASGVRLLRTYNTTIFPHSERILQAIRELKTEDPGFEMYVMLGAWIQCQNAYGEGVDHTVEDEDFNRREIARAIELAQEYPDLVRVVAVGNEAMVTWQAHFVPAATILKYVQVLKAARVESRLPETTLVTTSDNWAALGGEESYHGPNLTELLQEIDFLSLHTYAFHDSYYNPKLEWAPLAEEAGLPKADQAEMAIERSIALQVSQYEAVKNYLQELGIEKDIHIGETGWASLDNSHYGNEGTCAASEYIAKLFYDATRKWTSENNLTCFFFEAFDEPWKSNNTAGSEGHFGLFTVDGKAKYALWDLVDSGAFAGLSRGGNPISKTHHGDVSVLQEKLKAPRHLKFNQP